MTGNDTLRAGENGDPIVDQSSELGWFLVSSKTFECCTAEVFNEGKTTSIRFNLFTSSACSRKLGS